MAILLAMYHSPEYINEKKWFDFHVTITGLPLQHRIWLLTAASALEITDMPEIVLCTDEYVHACVDKAKAKRREKRT